MEKLADRNGYKVLDHGHVALVESMGSDMSVVRNARVSYNAPPRGDGSDEKLINYLVKNGHTSPFESVQFTFDVKAPIFVFRQWHRHRTQSYNEVSARYTELPEEYYVPIPADITYQHASNKQMRTDEQNQDAYAIQQIIDMTCKYAFAQYHTLLDMGTPRELARTVLPLGTYSHMFATVDLHNLMHFLRLRVHSHAQKEIRVYGEAMLKIIQEVVPISTKAFCEKYGIENA